MRSLFIGASFLVLALNGLIYLVWPPVLWSLILMGPLILVGLMDMTQTRHSVLRNYPVVGHMRYFLELISPEIRQYFIESDTSGTPFNRQERSVVYERAKNVRDTVPFGTVRDVYATGYEWVNHSLSPKHLDLDEVRVQVGGKDCTKPYSASLLNISAMSYGALSENAVIALNKGAKMGHFAHNTGEGSISPYHQQGGDLIWQIGTGYFGCRTEDGKFNPDMFTEKSTQDQVKMIEIKITQGAKPGHGGILPAAKLTEEIAQIRSVPMGRDVNSPPGHTAFTTPLEMVQFIGQLRELSGGKPIGFKLCVGKRREFLSICKAMLGTGILPDFITVDGGEHLKCPKMY